MAQAATTPAIQRPTQGAAASAKGALDCAKRATGISPRMTMQAANESPAVRPTPTKLAMGTSRSGLRVRGASTMAYSSPRKIQKAGTATRVAAVQGARCMGFQAVRKSWGLKYSQPPSATRTIGMRPKVSTVPLSRATIRGPRRLIPITSHTTIRSQTMLPGRRPKIG